MDPIQYTALSQLDEHATDDFYARYVKNDRRIRRSR